MKPLQFFVTVRFKFVQDHEEEQEVKAKKYEDDQPSEDEEQNKIPKAKMDKEEFDMEDFDITFNSHNPPITIPDEVSDVVDNDFDLPYSPPEVGGD